MKYVNATGAYTQEEVNRLISTYYTWGRVRYSRLASAIYKANRLDKLEI